MSSSNGNNGRRMDEWLTMNDDRRVSKYVLPLAMYDAMCWLTGAL